MRSLSTIALFFVCFGCRDHSDSSSLPLQLDMEAWQTIGNGEFLQTFPADIDNDGVSEVIAISGADSRDYSLHVFQANGSERTGWPISLAGDGEVHEFNALIGEIDGNGLLEIVVAENRSNGPSRIHAFRDNGIPSPGWPVNLANGYLERVSTADYDSNGVDEVFAPIVVGPYPHTGELRIFRGDGTELPKSPFIFSSGEVASEIVTANVEGDWRSEVLWCSTDVQGSLDQIFIAYIDDGTFLSIEMDGAEHLALVNLDEDEWMEMVVTGNRHDSLNGNPFHVGFATALNADGTTLQGWPKLVANNQITSGPALGDLDLDGFPEIVVSSFQESTEPVEDCFLHVWNRSGNSLPGFPYFAGNANTASISSQLVLADATGDGFSEIIQSSGLVFSSPFSERIMAIRLDDLDKSFPIATDQSLSGAPWIANLYGNGKLWIFSPSIEYSEISVAGKLLRQELPSLAQPKSAPWPMPLGNARNNPVLPD